jgi:hypothetical protein
MVRKTLGNMRRRSGEERESAVGRGRQGFECGRFDSRSMVHLFIAWVSIGLYDHIRAIQLANRISLSKDQVVNDVAGYMYMY